MFDIVREKLKTCWEFILSHSRIIMPVVLLICVAVTVIIAINENHRDALEKEAEEKAAMEAEAAAGSVPADTGIVETPEYELELNAYPEVNTLVKDYYSARANGDMLTVSAINTSIKDVDRIYLEEYSKFIREYSNIDVYTKPGLSDNSYVAYVCSEVKFNDYETALPGMQTYYVFTDEDGSYHLVDMTYDDAVYEYISKITLQDDVVDLSNRINVEYNEILASDEEFSEYTAYLKEKLKEEVGERLAQAEAPSEGTDNAASENVSQDNTDEEQNTDNSVTLVTKVKATDVVNIRKSDSEQADKLDKAHVGQEFTLIEEKPNGWSEIEYNGGSAFIKSDYLEPSETVAVNGNENAEASDDGNNADAAKADTGDAGETQNSESGSSTAVKGKVVINSSGVRLRKEPNTDSEIVATLYTGEKLDLIEAMSSGWSKVKYKNETAYVKSEFVKEAN